MKSGNRFSLFHLTAALEALLLLEQRYRVELPICQAVHDVLYRGMDPQRTLDGLFLRSLKREF